MAKIIGIDLGTTNSCVSRRITSVSHLSIPLEISISQFKSVIIIELARRRPPFRFKIDFRFFYFEICFLNLFHFLF